MIIEYCQKAMERATYRKLDDGSWYSELPGFQGVWANGNTVEACRKELIEVLEEWLILNPHKGSDISEVLLNEILRQASIEKADWEVL